MKKGKKHRGMKAEIRAYKKRLTNVGTAVMVTILIVITAISSYIIYSSQHSSSNPFQPKAAIVDQGSIAPTAGSNPVFIETATNILKQAGYTLDYYKGEKVTVKFYRNLPSYGYDLIIFRVHTTQRGAFFTSEPYSTSSYIWEQLNDHVWKVSYHEGDPQSYFGMSPSFVKSCMNGRFSETVVIAMGCDTLKFSDMAEAFIEKGAKAYIGWNGPVSANHTDQATAQLLKHLITEKQTIRKAVTETMKEMGPDPVVGSVLLYYPDSVDNYIFSNITSNLILNDAIIPGCGHWNRVSVTRFSLNRPVQNLKPKSLFSCMNH